MGGVSMPGNYTSEDQRLRELQDIVTKVSANLREAKNRNFESSSIQDKGYYEIHVVTPMFGGSAEAGKVDGKHPIRSSSIRGHLRFWWRATRGAQYNNEKELYECESKIFGNTSSPSAVKIWIDQIRDVSPKSQKLNVSYVLFPFINNRQLTKYYENLSFRLYIEIQPWADMNTRTEVEAALWAWINFGGIGARTRRGCGSLYNKHFSLKESEVHDDKLEKWFQDNLEKYKMDFLNQIKVRDWPTLSKITVQNNKKDIKYAWNEVIGVYKGYRRRANGGSEPGRPGRSHWPEADSIRKIARKFETKHKDSITISAEENEIAFPRAQFGLPIIFNFKSGRNTNPRERDPYPTELVPSGIKSRLASPVITKAIAISDRQGYGAIIVLNQPKINKLVLKRQKGPDLKTISEHQIYTSIPSYIERYKKNNPMRVDGKPYESAIEAFLNSEEVRKWQSEQNTKNPLKR